MVPRVRMVRPQQFSTEFLAAFARFLGAIALSTKHRRSFRHAVCFTRLPSDWTRPIVAHPPA
jgi:hypothetical protein